MSMLTMDPIPPPGPFDDFSYAFDPTLNQIFPSPPPLPSSADLFSASETTDLLGFLDNFTWDIEAEVHNALNYQPPPPPPQHHPMVPDDASMTLHSALAMSMPQPPQRDFSEMDVAVHSQPGPAQSRRPQRRTSNASSASTQHSNDGASSSAAARQKPLLSTPQKRLNHIMSEQKRRNAIRDGYVQLTTLLAPAGAPPGAGMPTRGRPKGSGSRASGRGRGNAGFKGKSGILFRAVEYIHWLETNREALAQEVDKVEGAAGVRHS